MISMGAGRAQNHNGNWEHSVDLDGRLLEDLDGSGSNKELDGSTVACKWELGAPTNSLQAGSSLNHVGSWERSEFRWERDWEEGGGGIRDQDGSWPHFEVPNGSWELQDLNWR